MRYVVKVHHVLQYMYTFVVSSPIYMAIIYVTTLHVLRDALQRGLPAPPSVAAVNHHLAGAHDLRQHLPQRHPFAAGSPTRHQLLQPALADPDRHLDALLRLPLLAGLLPPLCRPHRLAVVRPGHAAAVPGCVAHAVAHPRRWWSS